MKQGLAGIDRRTLLIGGGVGIGLIVAVAAWPRRPASALALGEGEQAFGHFIKIGMDGRVVVAVPQVETGQGIWTALPQIVADELGAAWESVAVEPAPLAGVYANPLAEQEGWLDGVGPLRRFRLDEAAMRITAGSSSIRGFEAPMRTAGAAARAMLIDTAAGLWDVPAEDCDTADGFVLHGGKTLPFAQLAEAAAGRSPPSTPEWRRRRRLAGQPLPRLDLPSKSDGSFRFAADVRLPDMLFASARLAPPDGRLLGHDREALRSVAGVRQSIAHDDWFAVVGETSWAAQRAIRVANPRFTAPEFNGKARDLYEHALSDGEAESWFVQGDYDAAVAGSRPLSATFWVAPSRHFALEPLTATARFDRGRLEVWAPTLAPGLARSAAAIAAGVSPSEVTFYPMPVGDPGGRALEADAIPVAVRLARRLNRPVQVTLSHGASENQDRVAPGALARVSALPGGGGLTAAWKMRVATSDGLGSGLGRLLGASDARGAPAGAAPPYVIPNIAIEGVKVATPFRTGYMRGDPYRALTFFTESFMDDLARLAGHEPLAFRMALLGRAPRLARCLQVAASAGGWDGGASGSTMGLAAASAFGSHIALLADATIGADQRIAVHRLVAAVDCGRIVNPAIVRQQIEGGLIWALGQAVAPEPDWVGAMPLARALGAANLPRIAGSPEIRVQLINSAAGPGGVSGLAVPVLAPAVANAIYAATGKRLRSLPFDPISAA